MSGAVHRYVGGEHPRQDARDKVTGEAVYVGDMALPGMLWARIKVSPHASARIVRVDTARARALPGVRAVLAGDALDQRLGLYMADKRILAREVVRYQGDPVAAVAADSEAIAARACELVEVEYEPTPPVLDVEEALRPGAPLVHPELASYHYMKGVFFPVAGSNIAHHQKIRRGDLARGFARADRVFEHDFWNPAVPHVPLETHAVIARALSGGRADIWSAAQSPFTVRHLMAVAFGLPHANVRVRVPYVGGGFGGKAGINLEPLAYVLSRAAGGRPVKLVATREEEMNTLPSRQGLRSHIKAGVTLDGKLVALEVRYLWDAGAHADYGVNIGRAAATAGAGPYLVPNVRIDSLVVYTNKVFGTAFRGFGHLEVLWGIERNMDIMAHALGIDPFELRQRNFLSPGDTTITGELFTANHGRPEACLQTVADAIGWRERPTDGRPPATVPAAGRVRGYGIAALHKAPAMPVYTSSSCIIKMNEDASVHVLVSGVDYGQGTYTALAGIAAQELSIPVEKVHVVWDCDTASQPYDWQTVASRFAVMGGNAVIAAARDCLEQLKRTAAEALHAPLEDLVCEDETVYVRKEPSQRVSYRQLAIGYSFPNGNSIGGPIVGRGRYIAQGLTHLDPETGQGRAALNWTYGAHGVVIEVDTETGEIEVLRIASCFDAGKVLHAGVARTQVEGGVLQGLGSALCEAFRFDDRGRLLNPSFVDYKIPTAKDLPRAASQHFVETPQLDGPHGARGIGEHPMIAVPSAIGNALYDALGIQIHELPMSAERVLRAIKRARLATARSVR
jgi:CO/xanthine dehydrogenase Mo-binding subunit